jgi:hypothetical protein
VAGQNPPYGASLHYWLKTASADSVTIAVADSSGKTVRTFKGPSQAGINRVYWDLLLDPSKEARLRTSPLYSDLPVGPDGIPAPGVGRVRLLAPPGRYTVTVRAAGQQASQPLTVRKDPNSGGSEAEIAEQNRMALDIVADLDATVDMINAIESARAQLAGLKSILAGDSAAAEVRARADSLERKLIQVEEPLLQMRVTGRGQDLLRWPMQLAEQLAYLAQSVTSSDFGPTQAQREVHQVLKGVLREARVGFEQVVNRDVAGFNRLLADRHLQGIVMPAGR